MCSHLFAVYQKGYRLFNKIYPCFILKEGIVYAINYISVLYQIKTPVKQKIYITSHTKSFQFFGSFKMVPVVRLELTT